VSYVANFQIANTDAGLLKLLNTIWWVAYCQHIYFTYLDNILFVH